MKSWPQAARAETGVLHATCTCICIRIHTKYSYKYIYIYLNISNLTGGKLGTICLCVPFTKTWSAFDKSIYKKLFILFIHSHVQRIATPTRPFEVYNIISSKTMPKKPSSFEFFRHGVVRASAFSGLTVPGSVGCCLVASEVHLAGALELCA